MGPFSEGTGNFALCWSDRWLQLSACLEGLGKGRQNTSLLGFLCPREVPRELSSSGCYACLSCYPLDLSYKKINLVYKTQVSSAPIAVPINQYVNITRSSLQADTFHRYSILIYMLML
jgi:hypothetical protein